MSQLNSPQPNLEIPTIVHPQVLETKNSYLELVTKYLTNTNLYILTAVIFLGILYYLYSINFFSFKKEKKQSHEQKTTEYFESDLNEKTVLDLNTNYHILDENDQPIKINLKEMIQLQKYLLENNESQQQNQKTLYEQILLQQQIQQDIQKQMLQIEQTKNIMAKQIHELSSQTNNDKNQQQLMIQQEHYKQAQLQQEQLRQAQQQSQLQQQQLQQQEQLRQAQQQSQLQPLNDIETDSEEVNLSENDIVKLKKQLNELQKQNDELINN